MVYLLPSRINASAHIAMTKASHRAHAKQTTHLFSHYSAATIPARTAPRPTPMVASGAAAPVDAALALVEDADPPLDAAADVALALELPEELAAEEPELVAEAEAADLLELLLEALLLDALLAAAPVGDMLLAPDTHDAV